MGVTDGIYSKTNQSSNSSVESQANIKSNVLKNGFHPADPIGGELQLVPHGSEHGHPQ